MTCPKCGNPVEKGDVFCESCGARLINVDTKPQAATPGTARPLVKKADPKAAHPKGSNNHKWPIITIFAIIIAVAALGLVAYLTGFFSVVLAFFRSIGEYVSVGSEGFWLIILFAAMIVITILWRRIAVKTSRTIRAKDYQRERELTGQMVTIETVSSKEQVQKAIRKRLRMKYFFPKSSDPNIWQCHYPGKPLTAGRGDEFTACIYFDDSDEHKTVLYTEFLRWREKNGVTRKRGLKAMQGFIDSVWNAVRSIDSKATIDTAKR